MAKEHKKFLVAKLVHHVLDALADGFRSHCRSDYPTPLAISIPLTNSKDVLETQRTTTFSHEVQVAVLFGAFRAIVMAHIGHRRSRDLDFVASVPCRNGLGVNKTRLDHSHSESLHGIDERGSKGFSILWEVVAERKLARRVERDNKCFDNFFASASSVRTLWHPHKFATAKTALARGAL